jgi:hypothetical protein
VSHEARELGLVQLLVGARHLFEHQLHLGAADGQAWGGWVRGWVRGGGNG